MLNNALNPNPAVQGRQCASVLRTIMHDTELKVSDQNALVTQLLALEFARGVSCGVDAAVDVATNVADSVHVLKEFDPKSECFPPRC
jgi:hypothetical protein